jgi:simple sugar transport system permease protein
LLHAIPVIGPALFEQPILTYIGWLLIPFAGWFLFRSWWGLALRACGESPVAARASGVPVVRVRMLATLMGGALAGIAGATLVLAQVGTFAERMTAGRGFIAIAIVVLGRWRPLGVLLAALLFGAAGALQFALQSMGLSTPYQLFLALPYLVALLALAGSTRKARAPLALGE